MAWLQQELKPQQMIWFQLLGREDLALECLVLVNKVNIATKNFLLSAVLSLTVVIQSSHLRTFKEDDDYL